MSTLRESIDNAFIFSSMHVASEPFRAKNIIIDREQTIDLLIDVILKAMPEDSVILTKPSQFQSGRDSYWADMKKILLEAKNER